MNRNIIVIGASSGGIKAISEILANLPGDLRASVFIVYHLNPLTEADFLIKKFNALTKLVCKFPEHEEVFKEQTIYLAPPDHHILLSEGKILVTQGPRENCYRPCIDTLFRSAASNYNSRVIGIIVSGMLHDGTNGLMLIKKCGGIGIVQQPEDAEYPEMPLSVLKCIDVDYVLNATEIGELLPKLVTEAVIETLVDPAIKLEAEISERITIDIETVKKLGTQIPYNCPDCGGALWEVNQQGIKQIRCQIGHAYSYEGFISAQIEKIEETLWVSLRMLEERHHILTKMAEEERKNERLRSAANFESSSNEVKVHIQRLREILQAQTEHRKLNFKID